MIRLTLGAFFLFLFQFGLAHATSNERQTEAKLDPSFQKIESASKPSCP